MAIWTQHYDPLGNIFISALVAAVPALLLLVLVALLNVRIHLAALGSLAACFVICLAMYRMPFPMAAASVFYGAGFGLFPIGWMVLNIMFIYQLTLRRGLFEVLRDSLAGIAPDPRIQLQFSKHRRGQHRDQLVRPRGEHPALRLSSQHRHGKPDGRARFSRSLCGAVHLDGGEVGPAHPAKAP